MKTKTIDLDEAIRRLREELKALERARAVLHRLSSAEDESSEEDDGAGDEVSGDEEIRWTEAANEALHEADGDGLSLDELIKVLENKGYGSLKRNTVAKFLRRGRLSGRLFMQAPGSYRARDPA